MGLGSEEGPCSKIWWFLVKTQSSSLKHSDTLNKLLDVFGPNHPAAQREFHRSEETRARPLSPESQSLGEVKAEDL